MKLKDITNAYLIKLLESSTELFQTKTYFSKNHVDSFLGLGIHRAGFYGKEIGDTIVPLKLNQTNFDEPSIVLHIEGVITLPKAPTNTGTLSYAGYGLIEVNGIPIYDGRGSTQLPPTSDDIANDSTVVGANVTQALNTLGNDLDDLENDFTSLSTDGVSNDSNVPGLSSTNALNNLKIDVDDLKDNTFKVTYYEILDISSTTIGSLQDTPTGATINEDQFGDSGNSVLSTVTVASTPTYESPLVGEVPVTVNLGVNGVWVASNTYPDPVALIYSINIEFGDWDNVDNSKIIDYYQLETGLKALAYKDKTELGDYEDDSIVGDNLADNTVSNDKLSLMTSWSFKANPTDNPSQPQDVNAASVTVGSPQYLFGFDSLGKFVKLLTPIFSPIQSVFGRTNPAIVAMLGDYTTDLVTEVVDKKYVTDAEKTLLSNTSGSNTGDETTSSIQTKRPLKTVNGNSLEGSGDVSLPSAPVTSVFGRNGNVISQPGDYKHSQITLDDGTNPHGTTKADVNLGNVNNTSDLNKPVSTATQTQLDLKINNSEKGQALGVATLDSGGVVPQAQLPFTSNLIYLGTWNANTNTPTLIDGTGNTGEFYICNVGGTVDLGSGPITYDSGDWVLYSGTIWEKSDNTSEVKSVHGRIGNVVGQLGDYSTNLIPEDTDKNYVTDNEKTVLSNTSNTNSGDETTATIQSKRPIKTVNGNTLEGTGNVVTPDTTYTDAEIKTKYENNADTNAFTDAEKTNLSNQSGINTNDETTATIQSKRVIKTVNGQSLEGVGNVVISGFDPNAEGVLTKYESVQVNSPQTSNSTTGVTYLSLVIPAVIGEKYLAILSFTYSHSAQNNRAFVDLKDFGVSVLNERLEVEPKDSLNRFFSTKVIELLPNPVGGGQFQLQLDFGSTAGAATTTLYEATLIILKVPV